MAINLDDIQSEHLQWAARNFPNATVTHAVLGVCEEAGELAHAQLKSEQKIRGDWKDHEEEALDAVGDISIYLMHWCNLMGYQLSEVIDMTWAKVKERDWVNNPQDGGA